MWKWKSFKKRFKRAWEWISHFDTLGSFATWTGVAWSFLVALVTGLWSFFESLPAPVTFVLSFGLFVLSLFFFNQYEAWISRRKTFVRQNEKEPISTKLKPAKIVEPDSWLLYAVHYVAYDSWEFVEVQIDEATYFIEAGENALAEIRQKAFDGDLPIWGKLRRGGPLKLIPNTYWENYDFEIGSYNKNTPKKFCSSKAFLNINSHAIVVNSHEIIYKELKTSKAKVEELWPIAELLAPAQPTFKATRQELNKLFLAVVTVRTKATNHQSFDDIKDILIDNFKFLQEHEAIFEGSIYQQDYREFMHASSITIGRNRNYLDREEMEYWVGNILSSSKILEEALK